MFGIECKDNESGSLTVSAGTIRLNDHIIELVLDIRYPVTVDGSKIVAKISSMRQSLKFDNIHIKHSAPHYYDPDNEKVLYLTKVYNKLTGSNLSPYTIGGGTHARLLPNAVGFGMSVPESPCLFEKGRGLYHQPDEALHIPSLIRAIKIYILAIAGIEM